MKYRLVPPFLVLLFFLSAFVQEARAQDIEGVYNVTGTNSNDQSYSGSVRISRTGDTYRLVWTIGNQSFDGTGIFRNGVLSVSFAGSFSGIVVYRMNSSGGDGIWATQNTTILGTENLKRRSRPLAP